MDSASAAKDHSTEFFSQKVCRFRVLLIAETLRQGEELLLLSHLGVTSVLDEFPQHTIFTELSALRQYAYLHRQLGRETHGLWADADDRAFFPHCLQFADRTAPTTVPGNAIAGTGVQYIGMRRLVHLFCLTAAASLALWAAPASKVGDQNLTDDQIQEIIEKFAAKEAEFARAREAYLYTQKVSVQELSPTGRPQGRWEWNADITFTNDGKRAERVTWAPTSTLQNLNLTPEDMEDLRNVQPFVLTTQNLPEYHVRYLGKQMADEIPSYVFAVKPKELEKGKRYFSGLIWVDDRDLQIVKTYGRATGIAKGQQFPKFETYRQQVDGKYWFPVYTSANDTLYFEDSTQRMKMVVKYADYKRFEAETNIKFGEVVEDGAKPGEAPKQPDTAPKQQ